MRSGQSATESELQGLLAAAAEGGREARDAIVRELLPDVRARVHSMLQRDFRRSNRWMLAAFSTGDIVQQVFIDVIRRLDKIEFRGRDKVISYLTTVAYRRIIGLVAYHTADRRNVRKHGRQPEGGMDTLKSDHDIDPGLVASLLEQIGIFREVYQTLSDRQQLLIELRLIEDVDYATIADKLGFASSDSARMAYYAARSKLVVRLQARGVRDNSRTGDADRSRGRRR